jgi:hypothetical protein
MQMRMLRILIYRASVAKRMVCARHFAAAADGRRKAHSIGTANFDQLDRDFGGRRGQRLCRLITATPPHRCKAQPYGSGRCSLAQNIRIALR